MADNQASEKAVEEVSDLDRLESAIKTNRLLFFVSFVLTLLIAGFIAVSHLSITNELGLRREVSSDELSRKFSQIDSYFTHLSELQNSQAKMYMTFDATLLEVKSMYSDDRVSQLRELMIGRETDHQRLLELMSDSVENLSLMSKADKKWLESFKTKTNMAKKDSKNREKSARSAMRIAG
ncbi:MAG: hypothetical protein ACRBCS_00080 [Cellvibrionaceae bacterium]